MKEDIGKEKIFLFGNGFTQMIYSLSEKKVDVNTKIFINEENTKNIFNDIYYDFSNDDLFNYLNKTFPNIFDNKEEFNRELENKNLEEVLIECYF